MKSDTRIGRLKKEDQFLLIGLIFLVLTSLLLQIILVSTNVFSWNWITGFTLGATFSTIALLLVRISVKEMVRTQNYFYYTFLFVARLGLYFIPFLMAVYIPNEVFGIFGVLWGFIPLALVPLMGVYPSLKIALKKEHSTQPEGLKN